MALRHQLQVSLAGLEKDLDLPAFPIDPDDLFFGKIRIGADESNPILFVFLIADTDDFCRNLPAFSNPDIDREQILAATAAFFTNTEDLLDR